MKFLSILTASKDEMQKKKALRTAKALKRRQEALIDNLEGERDDILTRKESLLSVTLDIVDTNSWNDSYQKCQIDLALLEVQIKTAKETLTELFTDGK